jgi:hypothetical protein
LILKVVDEFRILAIFAAQDLLQFEDRCVEGRGAVALEDVGHGVEETVAEGSIFAGPCSC